MHTQIHIHVRTRTYIDTYCIYMGMCVRVCVFVNASVRACMCVFVNASVRARAVAELTIK